jgi:hypothetical protein
MSNDCASESEGEGIGREGNESEMNNVEKINREILFIFIQWP